MAVVPVQQYAMPARVPTARYPEIPSLVSIKPFFVVSVLSHYVGLQVVVNRKSVEQDYAEMDVAFLEWERPRRDRFVIADDSGELHRLLRSAFESGARFGERRLQAVLNPTCDSAYSLSTNGPVVRCELAANHGEVRHYAKVGPLGGKAEVRW